MTHAFPPLNCVYLWGLHTHLQGWRVWHKSGCLVFPDSFLQEISLETRTHRELSWEKVSSLRNSYQATPLNLKRYILRYQSHLYYFIFKYKVSHIREFSQPRGRKSVRKKRESSFFCLYLNNSIDPNLMSHYYFIFKLCE